MATKVTEQCPDCGAEVTPTDRAIGIDYYAGPPVVARFWRYECTCGWRWANAAQREHNDQEFRRARRTWKEANGGYAA